MNEYIKYFDNLDQAEGYEIRKVPFSGYVKEPHLALFSQRWGDIKAGEVSYDRYLFYTTNDSCTVELRESSEFPELLESSYLDVEGVMVFSDSITNIGRNAFHSRSSLTSITIPNSVTSIVDQAFCYCTSLTAVTIPNSVTSIGASTFYWCSSLTSVTIPNSITSIESWTFGDCHSLTSITIPNSVTSISESVFSGCVSLTSVTLGSGVTSIGESAFYGCDNLTSIACEAVIPPTLGSNNNLSNVTAVYVPAESVEAYKTATNWSYYSNIIQPIQ